MHRASARHALRAHAKSRIALIDAQTPFRPTLRPTRPTRIEAAPEIPASSPLEAHTPHNALPLTDTFGRVHDYLRISLTERCNLRCTYCMPAEGAPLQPRANILTMDEIVRLARLFARAGVRKIRLTGGEPTLRTRELLGADGDGGLAKLAALPGIQSIGMTSNGIALNRGLPEFVKNGLTHLNLSLDTLEPSKFEVMTRRKGHSTVLSTLQRALGLLAPPGLPAIRGQHLESVKLNVVVIKGVNDDEATDFAAIACKERVGIRFIEYMPFGDNRWSESKLVPSATLLSHITQRYPDLVPLTPTHLSDTARLYAAPDWKGSVGFISSMTDHFCAGCSRLRITADGRLKVCLFGAPTVNLRTLLRNDVTDAELLAIIVRALRNKKFAHDGNAGPLEIAQSDIAPMVLIGGARELS